MFAAIGMLVTIVFLIWFLPAVWLFASLMQNDRQYWESYILVSAAWPVWSVIK